MKATIEQPALSKALDQAAKALPSKTTMPILNNYRIIAENGQMQIAATDLHVGVLANVAAEVAESGMITVNGAMFGDFVRGLGPRNPVTLGFSRRTSGGVLSVTAGTATCKLNCLDAEDYPAIPEMDGDGVAVSVGGLQLAELINQVVVAAAKDDSRPVLAGVLFEVDGDQLTMAAGDGFRLAAGSITLDRPVDAPIKSIIPANALRELAVLAAQQSSAVAIALSPSRSQALAALHATEWISSLIEGAFPNFRMIVPREIATEVRVNRSELMTAAKRSRSFVPGDRDTIQLRIETDPGELIRVTANTSQHGSTETTIDAYVTGPELTFMISEKFLTASLAVMGTDDVFIGLNGPKQTVVIRPSRDSELTHLIMPMVTPGEAHS